MLIYCSITLSLVKLTNAHTFGTTLITATILFIISILFSRVTVNVLVFVLRVVFFHLIVYVVTRYMYGAMRRDFALSASFVLECSSQIPDYPETLFICGIFPGVYLVTWRRSC